MSARDALAADLRANGDAAGAKAVKELRRPTVAAWAINQVARNHPDDVAELLDIGRDLRSAQKKAMSGKGGADLQEVGARRRKVVDRLVGLAARILDDADRSSAGHRDEIADTYVAATTDTDVAELARTGRLDREQKPSSDLSGLFGLADDDSAEGEAVDEADDVDAANEAAIAAAERNVERLAREAERAEERATHARGAADAAREEAERRERAAKEADHAARSARDQLEAAQQDLEDLRRGP